MRKFILSAVFATLAATAHADALTDSIIQVWGDAGYTNLEIKRGATTTKVEAYMNGTKVEVIYDNATAAELKREVYPAGARSSSSSASSSTTGFSDDSSSHHSGVDDSGHHGGESRSFDDNGDDDDSGRGRGRGGDDDDSDHDDDHGGDRDRDSDDD